MPAPAPSFVLPPQGTFTRVNPTDPLDSYYSPLVGGLYARRLEMALDILPRRRFANILEIGYGSGILVPSLLGLTDDYVGVDLDADPELVRAGLRKLGASDGVTLLQGDLCTLGLPQFDLVAAISIFEHVRLIGPFLDAVAALVRPGGSLLVGMPRVSRTMSVLFKAIGYSAIDDFHVTTYAEFRAEALRRFSLAAEDRMFRCLPEALALYHVGLFTKDG